MRSFSLQHRIEETQGIITNLERNRETVAGADDLIDEKRALLDRLIAEQVSESGE